MQHLNIRVALGAGVHAFDPSLGFGWREIPSWYPVEWVMEMVMHRGVAQQELPGTGVTGSLDRPWDPGGTAHHFLGMLVEYDLEGIIEL